MAEMYLEIITLFFIIGGFVALIFGVLLWFAPERVGKLSQSGNKWYSSRKSTKPLDVMRETDSFHFDHHLVVGLLMFFISILALFLIAKRIPTADEVTQIMGYDAEALGWGIGLEVLRWVLIVVTCLGFPVWLLLAFAPDKLKAINKRLNLWVSTRLLLLPLETMNTGFDGFVLQKHKVFSVIFILGALFILFKFLG